MYARMMPVTAPTMFTIYSFPSEKDLGKKKGGRGAEKKGDAQGGQESSDEEDANQAGEFHVDKTPNTDTGGQDPNIDIVDNIKTPATAENCVGEITSWTPRTVALTASSSRQFTAAVLLQLSTVSVSFLLSLTKFGHSAGLHFIVKGARHNRLSF